MITYVVVAVGCETFKDGSSVVVLNQTEQRQQKPECLVEKEINVGRNVTKCSLLSNQTQYLHDDRWQPLLEKTDSLAVVASENKTLLKVYFVFYNISKVSSNTLTIFLFLFSGIRQRLQKTGKD